MGWGWLCTVAILTLVPADLGGNSVNLIPFHGLVGDPFSLLNFALNVLLFVPAGILIAYSQVKPAVVWVLALILVSVGIELAQHYWGLGRAADANDVMASALGMAVGVIVVTRAALRYSSAGRDYGSLPHRRSQTLGSKDQRH